jgi:hypothetical protein
MLFAASYPTIPYTFQPRETISSQKTNDNNTALLSAFSSGLYRYNFNEAYVNSVLFITTGRNIHNVANLFVSGNATIDGTLTVSTMNVTTSSATAITATDATITNLNVPTIATINTLEITSLARFPDGTAAAPSIAGGESPWNNGIFFDNANSVLGFSTGGTERARFTNAGSLGIGTTNPSEVLHVVGNSYVTGVSYFSSGTESLPSVAFQGDPNTGAWNPAADNYSLSTGGAERFRVNSAGAIIVGDSPGIALGFGAKLAANNTSAFTTGFSLNGFHNDAFGQTIQILKSRATTPGDKAIVQNNDRIGNLYFAADDGNSYVYGTAAISSFVDGTPGTIDMPGRLVFSTTPDGSGSPTERMRIDSTGNVGIGTTTPSTRLSVNGVGSFGSGGASLPSITTIGDLDTGLWFPAENAVAFSTSANERVRINNTGVGIGTTNPSFLLDVRGGSINTDSFVYTDQLGSFSSSLTLMPSAGNNLNINLSGAGDLAVNTNQLYVDTSTGFVGIGTSSPGAKLDVSSQSDGAAIYISSQQNDSSHSTTEPFGILGFYSADASTPGAGVRASISSVFGSSAGDTTNLAFSTSHGAALSERLRITSTGQVLVGHTAGVTTGSSDKRFQVSGLNNADSSASFVRYSANAFGVELAIGKSRGTTAGTYSVLSSVDQIGTLAFYGADGSDLGSLAAAIDAYVDGTPGTNDMPGRLVFSTTADGASSPTERMRIDSAGNVGIGTNAPNANAILDVSSTTKAFMPPRMTTTQKNAIASPTAGMVVYDTTLNKLCVYTTAWETITSAP